MFNSRLRFAPNYAEQSAGAERLARALDRRAELTSHFSRVLDLSYDEARHLAKLATYAEVWGVGKERFKELMMRTATISLDAGDKYMMKQMGMSEEDYEQFILDILLEKYNLYQPKSTELPLIGKHYDKLILDDIQPEAEVGRNLGAQEAHGAAYGATAQAPIRATQSPLEARGEAINDAFTTLMSAQEEAFKQRMAVQAADALSPGFAEMLIELQRRNQYYLSCLQRYLDVSAFSNVVQAQTAVGRG